MKRHEVNLEKHVLLNENFQSIQLPLYKSGRGKTMEATCHGCQGLRGER